MQEHLQAHERHIEVTYEDLVRSRSESLSRLLEFIGVPGEELGTNLKMTNPWPLREMLTNFDEVAALLAPTEFAEMLETARSDAAATLLPGNCEETPEVLGDLAG